MEREVVQQESTHKWIFPIKLSIVVYVDRKDTQSVVRNVVNYLNKYLVRIPYANYVVL